MRRHRVLFLTLPFSLMLLSTSCSNQSSKAEVVEITSASMVKIEATRNPDPKMRVVAVGNGVAEILVALGLGESVVGRDIASEIDELASVPLVTNGHDLSAEKVLAQEPDLLIIDANTAPKSAINQVRDAGVRIVEIPESFEVSGIERKIALISRAMGVSERGVKLSAAVESALAEIKTGSARVLFLYLRGGNGIFLVGGKGSGADSMIEAAGAIDIGSTQYKNPFTPINSEAILGLKPDFYLLMSAGLESVGGIEEFRRLPGIDSDLPVITVDDSLLLSFGARTPDLIRRLNRAIYGN